MNLVTIIKNLLLYGFLLFGIVLLVSFIIERIRQKRIKMEKPKPKSDLIQKARIISNLSNNPNQQQYFMGSYNYSMKFSDAQKTLHQSNQTNQNYFRNSSQSNELAYVQSRNNAPRYTIVNEIMKENSKNFKKIYMDNYSASA